LFKPKSLVNASPSAAPVIGGTGTATPALAGGHGLVWVNTETHVYHKEGSRFYGTTMKGKYVSEADAIKEGEGRSQGTVTLTHIAATESVSLWRAD
jgi:hypothetical protein